MFPVSSGEGRFQLLDQVWHSDLVAINKRVLLFVENELQLRNKCSIFGGGAGGGRKLKQEAERVFEHVFNFSVLTTSAIGAMYRAIMNQRFNEIL